MFDLTGKVALITGSSSGIGQAVAEEMARSGAKVVISSIDAPRCAEVAAALTAAGHEAFARPCDVSDRDDLEALAGEVLAHWGRIDILVCNAGIAPHFGPLASASDTDYDRTMRVNLQSQLWLANQVIPQMAARRDGAIILMASLASIRGNRSIGLYSLSKAAVAALARNLAVEWGPSNIRVNAISPGVIVTDFARPIAENPDLAERRKALTPLRRFGDPGDIAGVAVFLASRAGAFVTGQNIVADGGTSIGDGN